jgi:hypothetical protein
MFCDTAGSMFNADWDLADAVELATLGTDEHTAILFATMVVLHCEGNGIEQASRHVRDRTIELGTSRT